MEEESVVAVEASVEQPHQEGQEVAEPAQGEETSETPAQEPEGEERRQPTTAEFKGMMEERRKRQELQRELDALKKQAETPPKVEELKKPKPSDFDDYDDYIEAMGEFKATEIFLKKQAEAQTLTKQQIAEREEQALATKAQKAAEVAAKKYPDFFEVASEVTLPQSSMRALYESDLGTEIAYHLGKNPAELERLLDLSPQRQIMELGKLESKLLAKTADPSKKQVREATKVESAGGGFQPPAANLTKLKEEAMKTGNWTKYLLEAGHVP